MELHLNLAGTAKELVGEFNMASDEQEMSELGKLADEFDDALGLSDDELILRPLV